MKKRFYQIVCGFFSAVCLAVAITPVSYAAQVFDYDKYKNDPKYEVRAETRNNADWYYWGGEESDECTDTGERLLLYYLFISSDADKNAGYRLLDQQVHLRYRIPSEYTSLFTLNRKYRSYSAEYRGDKSDITDNTYNCYNNTFTYSCSYDDIFQGESGPIEEGKTRAYLQGTVTADPARVNIHHLRYGDNVPTMEEAAKKKYDELSAKTSSDPKTKITVNKEEAGDHILIIYHSIYSDIPEEPSKIYDHYTIGDKIIEEVHYESVQDRYEYYYYTRIPGISDVYAENYVQMSCNYLYWIGLKNTYEDAKNQYDDMQYKWGAARAMASTLYSVMPQIDADEPNVYHYDNDVEFTIDADEKPGEVGVEIPAALVTGVFAIGAAAAGAAIAGSAGNGNNTPTSTFMMCVSKNFEDKIGRGENPLPVYARILEKTPTGNTIHRTDLSAQIQVYSGDNQLIVQDGGMKNGYKTALVSADKDTLSESGLVTFKFVGKDGTFIEHMKFKIIQPTIYFGQENIGLPAHYEKEVELHFSLLNMPDNAEAKVEIISPGNKKIYDVKLIPDEKIARFYSVKFKDLSLKDEADAGTTERHILRITATITDEKTHQTREVKKDFEIFRIHMGLVLKLEADAVGCYLLMKEGENEIMRQRAVGSDLGANLATPMAALDPSTALTSAGLNAMKDVNFGTNVKSHDVQPNYTTGRILLFFWDEEKQEIMRVPVVPKKEVEIRAISVGNDKNSLIGEASERHQQLVKALEIKAYATKDIDDKGMRLIKICSTKAGLDQPTRIRAEITFKATYLKKEYEVKKKVLLHSMPFRKVETPEQWKAYTDYDAKIQEQLERVKAKLGSSNKLEHYLPLYNLIDRMLKGYDFSFGYDRRQVERVMNTWIRIVQGKLAGMNEDAEKVTFADDVAAIYAFMQGMRDNGGLLGRIALGFCTYGYSEYLFFAMDLGEKMQAAVYACKGDKEFGFWDGVKMGIEEYEKQLAMELLLAGANVGMGKIHAKFHGGYEKDILGSIANKYRTTMDSIDKALKAKSSLYNNTAKGLESITQFTNASAGRLSNAIKNNDDAVMRAKQKADSLFDGKTIDPATLTAEELKAYNIQQLVNKRVQDNIFELRRLMKEHGTARASGNFADSDNALQDFIRNRILQDKNTYTYLNNLDDPFATTMRAEVQRVNMMQRNQIINNVLDDIALTTGKNRADLYVENATSNQEWRALAGERGKGPNDMDVTVHEYVHSDPSKSVVIDQTIGENALARETYKSYHNGMEAPSIEVAKDFTQKVDYTYVSPWMNQGNKYEIEWNPEAFYDLKPMIDPSKYGEALEGSGLDKAALEHKVNERITTAEKCEARADSLQAKAENLVGAEREAAIAEAEDLYCRSYAERVEAGRQLGKGKKIIDGRNKLYESEVGQSNVPDRVNEINAVIDKLKEGKSPLEVDQKLRDEFGIDMRGAAKETSQCLI